MTTTSTASGSMDTAGGAITRLNPADGLFLRAEHLRAMEDYASDLALAVGMAGGPGVVHGYQVSLSQDGSAVQVTGGLAIDPDGRPLRSKSGASAPVTGLHPLADEFYVVEIEAASWSFGSEGVYGALCDDPCGTGSSIAPYIAEGIRLTLRKDEFSGQLDLVRESERRNRLASLYFERERANGGYRAVTGNVPWLLPNARSAAVETLLGRPWDGGTAAPSGTAVPLAVLLQVDGVWVLDTWTARRDVADPPPRAAWQWRLGMRPWSVFVAQVLQLEDQLGGGGAGSVVPPAVAAAKDATVDRFVAEVRAITRSPKLLAAAAQAERQTREKRSKLGTLIDAGILELPPAGYLDLGGGGTSRDEVEEFAAQMFGGGVDVEVREVRPDYVAHAVEEVQHMDRIRLDGDPRPQVDVLVPMRSLVDLDPLRPDGDYGWVAYVRRREEAPTPPEETPKEQDLVEVYLATLDLTADDHIDQVAEQIIKAGGDPRFELIGMVGYPAGQWAVPQDVKGTAYADIQSALDSDVVVWGVVGLTTSQERRPLAAARAARMVVTTGSGQHSVGFGPTFVGGQSKVEAIFVVLGPVFVG